MYELKPYLHFRPFWWSRRLLLGWRECEQSIWSRRHVVVKTWMMEYLDSTFPSCQNGWSILLRQNTKTAILICSNNKNRKKADFPIKLGDQHLILSNVCFMHPPIFQELRIFLQHLALFFLVIIVPPIFDNDYTSPFIGRCDWLTYR